MPYCDYGDHDASDVTTHTLRFDDDTPPVKADLCAPCVRKARRDDDSVRSIT